MTGLLVIDNGIRRVNGGGHNKSHNKTTPLSMATSSTWPLPNQWDLCLAIVAEVTFSCGWSVLRVNETKESQRQFVSFRLPSSYSSTFIWCWSRNGHIILKRTQWSLAELSPHQNVLSREGVNTEHHRPMELYHLIWMIPGRPSLRPG